MNAQPIAGSGFKGKLEQEKQYSKPSNQWLGPMTLVNEYQVQKIIYQLSLEILWLKISPFRFLPTIPNDLTSIGLFFSFYLTFLTCDKVYIPMYPYCRYGHLRRQPMSGWYRVHRRAEWHFRLQMRLPCSLDRPKLRKQGWWTWNCWTDFDRHSLCAYRRMRYFSCLSYVWT